LLQGNLGKGAEGNGRLSAASQTPPDRKAGFLTVLAEDLTGGERLGLLRLFARLFFSTRFQLLLSYRITHRLELTPFRLLNPIFLYWQNILFGCYVSPCAQIGRRVRFAHPIGIVIGAGVVIGDDVVICQEVSLGSHGRASVDKSYPIIKDGVLLCAGAKIIGGITVGAGAIVGAGAVVLCDVPPRALAVGGPAIIKQRSF